MNFSFLNQKQMGWEGDLMFSAGMKAKEGIMYSIRVKSWTCEFESVKKIKEDVG